MKTEELKIFLHLAQSLSFHKSAAECFVSPSTLSRVVQRMEEELSCSLFERDNKKVALTSEGSRFVDYARDSLAKWSEVKTDLAFSAQVIQGSLSLFCSATAAYSILPSLLKSFRTCYPEVEIDLEVGSRHLALEKSKHKDLVVASFKDSAEVEKIPLATTEIVFVRGKNLVDPFAKGAGEFSLILTKKGIAGEQALNWLEAQGVRPATIQEATSNEAVLALVALGCGVGVMPKLVYEKSPLKTQLCLIPAAKNIGVMTVYLARSDKKPSPAAQALWKMTESVLLA
ncbi:MAG: LysR substrate-binding domain-containing protein [SAR324 cluster bacterium]|nr:LysR substrate-binding domain-containing protein [SAR324 cluster bacterium]